MNIIIASLALISSVGSLPGEKTPLLPEQTNKLSKAELVEIINTEYKANQKLEGFVISMPNLPVKHQRIASLRTNTSVSTTIGQSASGE